MVLDKLSTSKMCCKSVVKIRRLPQGQKRHSLSMLDRPNAFEHKLPSLDQVCGSGTCRAPRICPSSPCWMPTISIDSLPRTHCGKSLWMLESTPPTTLFGSLLPVEVEPRLVHWRQLGWSVEAILRTSTFTMAVGWSGVPIQIRPLWWRRNEPNARYFTMQYRNSKLDVSLTLCYVTASLAGPSLRRSLATKHCRWSLRTLLLAHCQTARAPACFASYSRAPAHLQWW
jgi:hypothetical protein